MTERQYLAVERVRREAEAIRDGLREGAREVLGRDDTDDVDRGDGVETDGGTDLPHKGMANGITVYGVFSTTDDTPARRLAAALPRADPSVDRVVSGGRHVSVWLADSAGEGGAEFDAPDGYEIDNLFISQSGNVCVRVNKEA